MHKNSPTTRSKPQTAEDVMAAMAREAQERAAAANGNGSGGVVERKDRRGEGVLDRRTGLDRRGMEAFRAAREAEAADQPDASPADEPAFAGNANTNLERRRGPGRRRTDFMKCADEGEMTQEQFLFIMAIDAFKRVNGKTFPTWTDVLEVIRKLGYRKTMPSELNLGRNTEDWSEAANAPAGVFKEAEED